MEVNIFSGYLGTPSGIYQICALLTLTGDSAQNLSKPYPVPPLASPRGRSSSAQSRNPGLDLISGSSSWHKNRVTDLRLTSLLQGSDTCFEV